MSQIDIKKILKESSLKATSQRLAIFDLLYKTGHPLSALEIKKKLRTLDQVTIYRTLEQFSSMGLISKLALSEDRAYYEYSSHHHHHAVCKKCGLVEEIDGCFVPSAQKIIKSAKKFTVITGHSMEFFGICHLCHNR